MFYRRNNSQGSADNGAGYMMFADDADRINCYGPCLWTFDGEGSVPVSELIDAAIASGFETEFYDASTLDPTDIIDSANAWDDQDAVMWIWENVCEPNGWLAVRTYNGAVIFDPAMAKIAL